MNKRFVYFYFMKNQPDAIRELVPLHVSYWKKLRLGQYVGGPFQDRSGGLISFEATDLDQATRLVEADPFVVHDLVGMKWLREWIPE